MRPSMSSWAASLNHSMFSSMMYLYWRAGATLHTHIAATVSICILEDGGPRVAPGARRRSLLGRLGRGSWVVGKHINHKPGLVRSRSALTNENFTVALSAWVVAGRLAAQTSCDTIAIRPQAK